MEEEEARRGVSIISESTGARLCLYKGVLNVTQRQEDSLRVVSRPAEPRSPQPHLKPPQATERLGASARSARTSFEPETKTYQQKTSTPEEGDLGKSVGAKTLTFCSSKITISCSLAWTRRCGRLGCPAPSQRHSLPRASVCPAVLVRPGSPIRPSRVDITARDFQKRSLAMFHHQEQSALLFMKCKCYIYIRAFTVLYCSSVNNASSSATLFHIAVV